MSEIKVGKLEIKISPKQEAVFSSLSFIGGFIWDALTIGKAVQPSDLILLFVYYLVAAVSLLLIIKKINFKFSHYLPFVMQFCLGSLFSSLFILYFKSAGSIVAYIFAALIATMLVVNEFFHSKLFRGNIIYVTIFFFCGMMYFNFLIPHLLGSIHKIWFYISTFLALSVTVGFKKFTPVKWSFFYPSGGLALLMTLLFVFNMIPPVPLVLKNSEVCRDFVKKGGRYTCQKDTVEYEFLKELTGKKLYLGKGERPYYLSSVFAPEKARTEIVHKWYFYEEKRKEWLLTDTIPFGIKGGRQEGWRLYSAKKNTPFGKWKTVTSLKDGADLGYTVFTIINKEEVVINDTEERELE